MNKRTFHVRLEKGTLRIFVNGLPHLILNQAHLVGIQSWVDGDAADVFVIEYTMKENVIRTEYDSCEKWEDILLQLGNINLFKRL